MVLQAHRERTRGVATDYRKTLAAQLENTTNRLDSHPELERRRHDEERDRENGVCISGAPHSLLAKLMRRQVGRTVEKRQGDWWD